ncbi:MAG: hypothetical protein Q9209_002662 [Squamulea sp. 1 TL-2023]
MARQDYGWSRAQAGNEAKVATQPDAPPMPDRAANRVGTRARMLPVTESLNPPTPCVGSESLLRPRQPLEWDRHAEASYRQQRPRASTPASDEINWGSDPSPVSGEPSRPRPGFARTQDMMEGLAGRPPKLHAREHRGASEIPPEDRAMQTCEPEGRDIMLALKAQKQEYLTTEERRLDELVQAEDRIRELEQVNEVLASIIRDEIYLRS